MVCVRPGVLLVLAILFATSELIRLDLPTLERPTKAISGAPGGGNCFGSAADVTKRVRTFIFSISLDCKESASGNGRTLLVDRSPSTAFGCLQHNGFELLVFVADELGRQRQFL